MIQLDIDEAKLKLTELIKLVEKGELVTITKNTVPVADLIQSASRRKQQTADAIDAIKNLQIRNRINQEWFKEMLLRGRR